MTREDYANLVRLLYQFKDEAPDPPAQLCVVWSAVDTIIAVAAPLASEDGK